MSLVSFDRLDPYASAQQLKFAYPFLSTVGDSGTNGNYTSALAAVEGVLAGFSLVPFPAVIGRVSVHPSIIHGEVSCKVAFAYDARAMYLGGMSEQNGFQTNDAFAVAPYVARAIVRGEGGATPGDAIKKVLNTLTTEFSANTLVHEIIVNPEGGAFVAVAVAYEQDTDMTNGGGGFDSVSAYASAPRVGGLRWEQIAGLSSSDALFTVLDNVKNNDPEACLFRTFVIWDGAQFYAVAVYGKKAADFYTPLP